MSATPTAQPEVLWAQRSSDVDANRNVIWLTISVPDLDPSSVKVEWTNPSHLRFEGTSNPPHMQKGSTASQVEKKHFVFDYDLFGEVEEVTEKRRLTNKSLILTVKKKELTEEYWPRLIKEKKKVQTIKTDFSKRKTWQK
ncbi:HSP20-like chaperone [Atractiella rhizophila]|nr:HSP20-like chaperone [Atractiella rhizophila]